MELLEGVLLVLLAQAVASTPLCPVAQGDSCKEVRFFLWTSANPAEPQEVTVGNISASHFNNSHPTKFVIHGYASGMDLPQLADIRKEYLLRGPHNLISPQYLELADSPCYLTAVVNLDYVGKCVARFVRGLDVARRPLEADGEAGVVDVLDLHLVGFSLGGQTAAFVANHLRPEFLLDRITGLDPAFPLFTTSDKDRKLTPDDALFVDVFHANAFVQGQGSPCGTVDFYMNGGVRQPGCDDQGFLDRMKCDHHRAPIYFAESIRSPVGFWGWNCTSIEDYDMGRCPATGPGALAGDGVDRASKGFYIVETKSSEPFARGRWWLQDQQGEAVSDQSEHAAEKQIHPTVTLA
ncbi:pancreatic lipase-related protein 2-like [Thrips palmi]|uniref:Pancreatic lipase-related protein 2-like n=1 Tax=Thrips palmi TaxID=161013 RepID=A0A6P9ADH9_THRPL|nr:pancreatic lipase-related protein 2-like [Thrips palmi]